MFRRLLFWLILIVVLGSIGLYFGAHYIEQQRQARYDAAANEKKQDYAVTIVEGKRREEIAQQMAAAGICSYTDFMTASQNEEGYLFPDTYRFFKDTPAATVVKTLTDNFAKRTASLNPTEDDIILASIVEREAENDTDRPIIAGVYTNRLNSDMMLQSDPTVQYGKDSIDNHSDLPNPVSTPTTASFKYWKPITQDDYHGVNSPYNTYLNTGLPPGPIANPGLASIKAAMNPASTPYYFFLYSKSGQLLLAKTYAQHQAQAAAQ